MIYDSHIWKKELKRNLTLFKKYITNLDLTADYNEDTYNLKVEKFFFLNAYIIRKLIEACKISDELLNKKYYCKKYEKICRTPTLFHNYGPAWDIDKEYNLDNEQHVLAFELRKFCNYFIHSFILGLAFDEEHLISGVFINSSFTKEKHCLFIDFEVYEEIILNVYEDNIVSTKRYFEGDKLVVLNSCKNTI